MLLRKPLLLLLLLFCCAKGFSATFVVTSNADSGPGTLRDALTQAAANGTAVKDYITFNLPDTSQTGRIIYLITQLPDLSSNLVIDGSTQSGSAYGSSGARVQIYTPKTFAPFILFNGTGLTDVEFYGLFMHDYTNSNESHPDQQQRIGVNITNSSNIILGAPSKGILIEGFWSYTMYFNNVNNITFKASVFGLSSNNTLQDPTDYNIATYTGGISLYHCNNIQVGGDELNEGNIIFCHFDINLAQKSTNNNIVFKSNNFGIFQDGKTFSFGFQDVIFVNIYTENVNAYGGTGTDLANAATANVGVENNLAGVYGNVFYITAINGSINFYNNFFGISRDGTVNLNQDSHPDDGNPINLFSCRAIVNIGSNDASKGNFIANSMVITAASDCPNVLVRNNEYECIGLTGDNPVVYGNDNFSGTLPVVSINALNTNNGQSTLSGTATPGALVDIYGSESCTYSQCSIRKFIETVTADANGVWNSNIINFSGIFYVSATKNNVTSLFKTYEINAGKVVVSGIRCSGFGSITGIQVPLGMSYHWVDSRGNIVSNNIDLVTNKPDTYQLILGDGCITSAKYEIDDDRLVISDYGIKVINPSCGNTNGSITGLFAYDPESKISKKEWVDAGGNIINNSNDISALASGTYTFKVFTSDGCETDYGPITLKNATGPNIDQSGMAVQSTNCGQSTGSITNLNVTGTGNLKYTWTNSQQQTVGTNKDLTNQPGGIYKLEVSDDTQCGPVYSADITIPETNGITMDETNAQSHQASCGNGNGSVTGIQVTGANTYQWTDVNNKIVGNEPNLTNVVAGTYMLTASNATGCSKNSKTYTVIEKPATAYPAYSYNIVNTCPHYPTGSISITADNLVSAYHWVNSAGMTYGNTPEIDNLPADTYTLYLTDANGCESLYNTFKVTAVTQLAIVEGTGTVTDDQCGNSKGGITGVQVSGGTEPYVYRWTNASGTLIATTADLGNVQAGYYKLNVHDASNCGDASVSYTVANDDNIIPTPSVSNVQVCSSGSAIVSVNNASATGMYNLYDSESSTTPVDQQTGGKFKVDVNSNTSFYITQINGTCESNKAKVDITVGLSALNIANTFTPNGDGINDYWKISNIENYPQAEVQVFTRYGQKVFESKGYQVPFDGTCKGQNLPAGVYYFIINLHSNCSLLSGSLTILR